MHQPNLKIFLGIEHFLESCKQKVYTLLGLGAIEEVTKCTPLHKAVSCSKPEKVRVLLQLGVNTELKDHNDCTPLQKAVANGKEKIVEILVKEGSANTHPRTVP